MSNRDFLAGCYRMLRPDGRALVVTLVATLCGGVVFGAVDPLVQKFLIDSLGKGNMLSFVAAAVALVVSGTLARGLGYLSTVRSQRLKNNVAQRCSTEMLRAYYALPYPATTRHERGYFVARVHDEPWRLASELVETLQTCVRSAVVLVGAASVALWLSWQVTLGVALIVPLLIRRARRSSTLVAALSEEEGEREAMLKAGLGRAVDAYKTVALLDLHESVHRAVTRLVGAYESTLFQRVRHGAAFQASSGLVMSYAELAITLGAAIQVVRGELSVGGLFAFMGAYFRVMNAANALVSQVPAVAKLKGGLARVEEFAGEGKPIEPALDAAAYSIVDLEFAFDDKPVLHGLTLSLRRGERVLLRGPNGSGKTTLAHVMAGFLGQDGDGLRRPSQQRISALLLPFGFIPGTVRDNAGLEGLSPERSQRFLDLAGSFGISGQLDQDPTTLSQGQQRKLQVVLTLMKEADFYILDEPLSNVDVGSKELIMREIFRATEGAGLCVIMHGDEDLARGFTRELQLEIPAINGTLASTTEASDVFVAPAVTAA